MNTPARRSDRGVVSCYDRLLIFGAPSGIVLPSRSASNCGKMPRVWRPLKIEHIRKKNFCKEDKIKQDSGNGRRDPYAGASNQTRQRRSDDLGGFVA